ncbi:MAG: hypothetical protein KDD53_12035, partial [Bdellovibrionales bacterium]|nr:hypothetical protein [Bdellovibrionales bacterium]
QLQRGNFAKAKELAFSVLRREPQHLRAQEISQFVETHIEKASQQLESGHMQEAAANDPVFSQYLRDPNRTDFSS